MLTFGNENLKNKITEVSNHATTKRLSLPWLLTLQLNYLTVLKDSIRKVKIRGLPNAVTFGDLWQIKTSLGLGFLLTEDETIPKAQTAAQASSENKRCSPACLPHPLLGENASWTPSLSAACVPNSDGADC